MIQALSEHRSQSSVTFLRLSGQGSVTLHDHIHHQAETVQHPHPLTAFGQCPEWLPIWYTTFDQGPQGSALLIVNKVPFGMYSYYVGVIWARSVLTSSER